MSERLRFLFLRGVLFSRMCKYGGVYHTIQDGRYAHSLPGSLISTWELPSIEVVSGWGPAVPSGDNVGVAFFVTTSSAGSWTGFACRGGGGGGGGGNDIPIDGGACH